MGIKGTKTEQNLLKAFAGESQARNRYTFFASVAKKDGLEQISRDLPRDGRQRAGTRPRYTSTISKVGPSRSRPPTQPARRPAPPRIFLRLPRARRKSGATCTRPSPRWPKKRVSPTSRLRYTEIAEVEEQHELRYRKLLANSRTAGCSSATHCQVALPQLRLHPRRHRRRRTSAQPASTRRRTTSSGARHTRQATSDRAPGTGVIRRRVGLEGLTRAG